MTHKENLHYIWSVCYNWLNQFGPVIIAGGAPRNVLMDIAPKDYDVFILNDKPFKEIQPQVSEIVDNLKVTTTEKLIHRSEPYLVRTLTLLGASDTQVMVVPFKTADELLSTFDWNVCLFAYDGTNFICKEDVANIGKGKELKLNLLTYPRSTLRRGYRFSERFGMTLPFKTVDKILEAIILNKNKKIGDYSI